MLLIYFVMHSVVLLVMINMFLLDSLQLFANDINTVDVDAILPMMIEQQLVTLDQHQDLINPLHTPAAKQQKLCSIILGLPDSCVNRFLHCLQTTSCDYEPHRQLYDKLCVQLKNIL